MTTRKIVGGVVAALLLCGTAFTLLSPQKLGPLQNTLSGFFAERTAEPRRLGSGPRGLSEKKNDEPEANSGPGRHFCGRRLMENMEKEKQQADEPLGHKLEYAAPTCGSLRDGGMQCPKDSNFVFNEKMLGDQATCDTFKTCCSQMTFSAMMEKSIRDEFQKMADAGNAGHNQIWREDIRNVLDVSGFLTAFKFSEQEIEAAIKNDMGGRFKAVGGKRLRCLCRNLLAKGNKRALESC